MTFEVIYINFAKIFIMKEVTNTTFTSQEVGKVKKQYPKTPKGYISCEEFFDKLRDEVTKYYEEKELNNKRRSE